MNLAACGRNPIPDYGSFAGAESFQPVCKDEHPECINQDGGLPKALYKNGEGIICKCSGEWVRVTHARSCFFE